MRVKFSISFVLLFAACLFAYVQWWPLPTYAHPEEEIALNMKAINIEEGRKLALSICYSCHYNPETKTLAGRLHGNPSKLGSFYSGNITRDKTFGIGDWTDQELVYFLVTGIKPNGEYVFDMPKYPNLSPEDLSSLIGFLRSDEALLAATPYENPQAQYSWLMKFAIHFWLRPIDYSMVNIENNKVDTADKQAYGKYLATAKYSCFDCHSKNAFLNNYFYPEKSIGFFRGANPHVNEQGEIIVSPSLIGIETRYTEEEFVQAVKTGLTPEATMLRNPMLPFTYLSDYEVESMYLYLSTLKKRDD